MDTVDRRARSAAERRSGAVARLRDTTATSAGGIVVDYEDQRPRLVVGMRRRERNAARWTLPKGTPHAGESLEETAIREVGEETGLRVRIVEPLPSIEYRFVLDGARIHKTVHYWLMEPTGGDLADHDHEFEQVRWVSFDEAPALLTFETERELVAAAAERLGDREPTIAQPLGGEPAT
jgi:8-oxo-dGTP pyrophosphatase MutT (NUDIX family)